jgi:hypothetical protein
MYISVLFKISTKREGSKLFQKTTERFTEESPEKWG